MILAVDCGSTYLKAALFASPSCRLAEVREPFRYSRRDRIHAEFTVAWLNGAFDRMVRRLSREAGQPLSAVRVLAFASQAQTFTLLDAAGRPLRRVRSIAARAAGTDSWLSPRARMFSAAGSMNVIAKYSSAAAAGDNRLCAFRSKMRKSKVSPRPLLRASKASRSIAGTRVDHPIARRPES